MSCLFPVRHVSVMHPATRVRSQRFAKQPDEHTMAASLAHHPYPQRNELHSTSFAHTATQNSSSNELQQSTRPSKFFNLSAQANILAYHLQMPGAPLVAIIDKACFELGIDKDSAPLVERAAMCYDSLYSSTQPVAKKAPPEAPPETGSPATGRRIIAAASAAAAAAAAPLPRRQISPDMSASIRVGNGHGGNNAGMQLCLRNSPAGDVSVKLVQHAHSPRGVPDLYSVDDRQSPPMRDRPPSTRRSSSSEGSTPPSPPPSPPGSERAWALRADGIELSPVGNRGLSRAQSLMC